MVSISRILCPVDFSQYSHRALDYAVAMAKWYEATVTALHVFPMAPVVDMMPSIGVGGLPPLAFTEEDREALRTRLREFSPAAIEPCVDLVVEQAPDIRTEILDQADARKADLIVVGSHGRSGFQHLLLGSTTERILRKARVPVLVVPRKQGDDVGPPAMPFTRIVCPVDFSEASLHALTTALGFAEEADATLVILHVLEMPPELHEMQEVLTREVHDVRAEAEARALRRLGELIPEGARDYCSVRTAVVEGSAHREIIRTSLEHDADLIVMGIHGRGAIELKLFGSNTHAVLRQANCPVLSVYHD